MHDLVSASATEISRAIYDREVSTVETVERFLERIEKVNPELNAIVELRCAAARADAESSDAALARGEWKGPLHGVPVTVKEAIATAGMRWSGGTKGRARVVAQKDATAVKRLRDAGAIILGTTNVPDMSYAYETDNLIYGRTNNPYNLSRTAGGSSGGEGAIIAACGTPLGLGGDFMGSIRVPSHFCGIAGLRPNPGRVAGTGYFPAGGLASMLAQPGPMARHVDDLALMLPVIAGPDGLDPMAAPVPLLDPKKVQLRGMRVAFYTDNGVISPSPETVAAVVGAASALEDAGAVIEERRPPGVEHVPGFFMDLLGADGGSGMRRLLKREGSEVAHPLLEEILGLLQPHATSAAEFMAAWSRWHAWRGEMVTFFETYDVVLAPVCAQPAMPHGATLRNFEAFSYVQAYSLSASPVVVVRAGTSVEGLPIGIQVVPRYWREDLGLAAARYIESVMGGWKAPVIGATALQ
jgi:amidase